MIVIVGAGLAGLVCAKELSRRGIDDYLLLEAEDAPGGRVRSRITPAGYVLDHGFQVLLDSYPAVRRHLNVAALEPRYFDSGAILRDGRESWTVADPRRHPADLTATALDHMFPWSDKARFAALVAELLVTPDDTLLGETTSDHDCSTAQYLWQRGFSPAITERFFRPFFGGVFLDEKLGVSAGLFRYYLKKFATGGTLLPARGIGQITAQLAAGLPTGKLRYRHRIDRLERLGSGADAVVTTSGERIACDQLLLATDAPATARLLDRRLSITGARGVSVAYFSSETSLYDRRMLILPAGRGRLVQHFVQITNVAPEYAPVDQHLISATVLNRREMDDATLFAAAGAEITTLFPSAHGRLVPLEIIGVPYAQHRQPAGFARRLTPAPAPTFLDNVWLAGDQTSTCSIQSAMNSGERAAAFFASRLAE